jgi:hypothetical protein
MSRDSKQRRRSVVSIDAGMVKYDVAYVCQVPVEAYFKSNRQAKGSRAASTLVVPKKVALVLERKRQK